MPDTQPIPKGGGCLPFVVVPFWVIGLFCIWSGYHGDASSQHIGLAMGSVFALVGVLIFFASMGTLNKAKRDAALQAEHPTEPWLCNKNWAKGKAPGQTGGSALGLWLAALAWNGVIWPTIYGFANRPARGNERLMYLFIGVFALVGIGLLYGALLQAMRLARFGRTVLQLQTVPAALGAKLSGTIDVGLPYPLPHGINLLFSCVNRVTTGSGRNRSTAEYIRWQEHKKLSSEEVMAGPSGTTVPVEFDVPRTMPPTDHSKPNDMILWLVRAEADVAGVDFDEKYEVPVYATSASPSVEQWEQTKEVEARRHPPMPPVHTSVEVSPAPEGGTQFFFPAGRSTKSALATTLAFLIFCGVEYMLFTINGPIFLPIIFGLIAIILLIVSLKLWFGSARIVANADGVTLYTNTLGLRSSKRWASSEIQHVYTYLTVHSQDAHGGAYYNIMLRDANLREITLGKMIQDHNEAEWICEQIRQIAHVEEKVSAAGR